MEIQRLDTNDYLIIFANSGHTMGNLLQKELLQNPEVLFAGYLVPHPLETKMRVRIKTTGKNPREIMIGCINNIIEKLDLIDSLVV
jgi:DNA-directed RNA polymerase II subunit RPB11